MLTMIVRRATSIFYSTQRIQAWFCAAIVLLSATIAPAREKDEAEAAARALAQTLEKEKFEFRAEAWVKDLQPDIGRAVRVQLFKGNDYRFCVAVPLDSQVRSPPPCWTWTACRPVNCCLWRRDGDASFPSSPRNRCLCSGGASGTRWQAQKGRLCSHHRLSLMLQSTA